VPSGTGRLAVYIWDRFGDLVRTLVDEADPPLGDRDLLWDGKNDAGQALQSGQFIWRVSVDGAAESRLVRLT
jgi:flagellar hook assembly protein FlgD